MFHKLDFETSELDFQVPKSSIWKHTFSFDRGVYSIIISQLQQPIEFKIFTGFYFVHMFRNTKWEDWSLTITKGVQCLLNLFVLQELVNEHTYVSVDYNAEVNDWQSIPYCDKHMHRIQLPFTPVSLNKL